MAKRNKNLITSASDASRTDYLRQQLDDLDSDIEEARGAGSWQAVASLRRQALVTRDALDTTLAATAPAIDPTVDLSDEQLVAELVAMVPSLPELALERVEQAIRLHRQGKPALSLVGSGA